MPVRRTPLANGQYYHIFCRSVANEHLFVRKRDCQKAYQAIYYYRFQNPPQRMAHFNKQNRDNKAGYFRSSKRKSHVELFAYCLMPNHFHLLVKQVADNGISSFMSLFQNSYAKYYNIKHKRGGSLFQGPFKAVRVESDSLLLHISRYIHVNPYTSFMIKSKEDLINYPWSSFPEYLGLKKGFCNTTMILANFSSPSDYKQYVFDQADYQRSLGEIKYLIKHDVPEVS